MESPTPYEPAPGKSAAPEPWTAARVAALRSSLGLTQAAFAGELGVRQQTVSEWETGRYQPRGASARLLTLFERQAPYDPSPPGGPS